MRSFDLWACARLWSDGVHESVSARMEAYDESVVGSSEMDVAAAAAVAVVGDS